MSMNLMTFGMKKHTTRTTRIRDAKYHIDLLKIYDEKDRNYYVLVKKNEQVIELPK